MSEIFRPQQENSEETNPVLTGVSVGLQVVEASMKFAEIAIDEFSGNSDENRQDTKPVYMPQEQENHQADYIKWLSEQQETEIQQLGAVRSELASFMPSQPERAISTPSENISITVPLTPTSFSE